jgi:2-polyprenyl-3-methyl-5-hydroxy-6-metoxy-1,4-benzoquinol methylase
MTNIEEKYDGLAEGFSERDYADPVRYSAGRARLIVELGPRLQPGDTLLDLGCGDGIMAGPLSDYGLVYSGIDLSTQMVEVARRRHPELTFGKGRFEEYRPPEPVDATICLRAFEHPTDRVAFFRNVAGYTRKKFVLDFREPNHPAVTIERDLRAAGFTTIEMRTYFVPQRRAVPGLAVGALEAMERTGPVATFLSRFVGRIFCSASV